MRTLNPTTLSLSLSLTHTHTHTHTYTHTQSGTWQFSLITQLRYKIWPVKYCIMFWDVARCNFVEVYRRFGEANCLHHRKAKRSNQQKANNWQSETLVSFYHVTRRHITEKSKRKSYHLTGRGGLWLVRSQGSHIFYRWRWGCQP
jgi:hypothetical protein